MRKVYLDNLPKSGSQINWRLSIGYIVKFIYDDTEGQIEIINYDKKHHYLFIKYLNYDSFRIHSDSFKKCSLGNLLGYKTSKFRIKIGTIFCDNNRNLIIIDKEYREHKKEKQKWYKYRCNNCGWDKGWIIEAHLLKNIGCGCCCGLTVVNGINDIPTTAPWMVKYFQMGYQEAKLYTKSSGQKIYPICPECGKVKIKPIKIGTIFTTKSIGCYCGDGISYPNKIMCNLLNQFNINFVPEYSPDWIKPRKYDFYFELNNKKYIVEMDGEYHYKDNWKSGQTVSESKNIDNEKDKKAKINKVNIIRIDCRKSDLDYIKNNIINSDLVNIFDLSNINWNECEEFATSNLVKKACNFKKDHPNLTTTEIGKLMKMTGVTIRSYLIIGNRLGWCNYIPKNNSKSVICLDTNEVFSSVVEAANKKKISNVDISKCCTEKRKTAGKYHWMFYDKYIKLGETCG